MLHFLLIISGLLFGSFASVLITRVHTGKSGIFLGRSECSACRKQLSWKDLIPVLSYIFFRGKCRYCNKKIGIIYPILEIVFAVVFLYMWRYFWEYFSPNFWPDWGMFFMSMFFVFIALVVAFYDIRYMEIPDEVILPTISLFFLFLSWVHWGDVDGFIGVLPQGFWLDSILGASVLYGLLFIQILMPGALFFIRHKRWADIFYLILQGILFPLWMLLRPWIGKRVDKLLPELENIDNMNVWVWAGDLRVAIFMGIFLGLQSGLIALLLAYIFGGVLGVFLIISGKRELQDRIPFAPFLILGFLASIPFSREIVSMFFF